MRCYFTSRKDRLKCSEISHTLLFSSLRSNRKIATVVEHQTCDLVLNSMTPLLLRNHGWQYREIKTTLPAYVPSTVGALRYSLDVPPLRHKSNLFLIVWVLRAEATLGL